MNDPDWELHAREIDLDINGGIGTAHGVKLDFKGVPILYAPYFSSPIDGRRKSGFLTPDISERDRTGFDLSVPYYLNLAPNYDLTLEPRYMSKRGMQLDSDFRYLQRNSEGQLGFEYLPNDDELDNATRSYVNYHHRSLFGDQLAGAYGSRGGIGRHVLRGPRQQLERDEPDASEPLRRLDLLHAVLVAAHAAAELSDHRHRAHGRAAPVRARSRRWCSRAAGSASASASTRARSS